jgi:hypothetical protein
MLHTRRPALLILLVAPAPRALADSYPIGGRWGQSTSAAKGPVDCSNKRVILFTGDQRRDSSNGGVSDLRNKSIRQVGRPDYA